MKQLLYSLFFLLFLNSSSAQVPGCLSVGTSNCNDASNGDFSSGSSNWSMTNWSIGSSSAEFTGDNTNIKTGELTQSISGLDVNSDEMLISFKVKLAFDGCNPDFKFINLTVRYEGIDYLLIERQNGGSVVSPITLKNGGILVSTDSDIYAGKRVGSGPDNCDLAQWHSVKLLVPKTVGNTTGEVTFYADENNGKFSQQVKMSIDDVELSANPGACGFMWLKADAGTSTTVEGGAIQTWSDQGASGNDASQSTSTRQPTFNKNVLNYNPGVYFDGSSSSDIQRDFMKGEGGYSSLTQVVVFKTNTSLSDLSSAETLIGTNVLNEDNDVSGFKIGEYSVLLANEEFGVLVGNSTAGFVSGNSTEGDISRGILVGQSNDSSDSWNIFANGELETNASTSAGGVTYTDWAFQDYVIGASPDSDGSDYNDYLTGHLLEVISYPTVLSSTELQKMNTYLGLKYSITLGQNYVSGDGTTIYDVSSYGNRVFGIGRDDCQGLHQRQSKIESETGSDNLLAIGYNGVIGAENSTTNGNDLLDGSYIVIGDNNAAINTWVTTGAPIAFLPESERVAREWKTVVTGGATASPVKIQVDGLKLPGAFDANERLALVIADNASDIQNATFTDVDKIIIPMIKSGDDWYCNYAFPNVGTKYFTLIKHEGCYDELVCTASTTWNGTTWSNGVPDEYTEAVIAEDYYTTVDGDFAACKIVVNPNVELKIGNAGLVKVQSDITINGELTINNNGSLVQYYDNADNTGQIKVERTSNPMYKFDYTYWSSPVEQFNMVDIPHNRAYYWNDTTGGWSKASGTMAPGKGYILMTDLLEKEVTTETTAVFEGAMNNGRVYQTVSTENNNEWVLLGNPYPSALDAYEFLSDPVNAGIMEGTVYLWTHNTRISDYANNRGDFVENDYATWNLTGGVGTGSEAGSGGVKPNGKIASGQGFFVEVSSSGKAKFSNCMRATDSSDNSQFYRVANNSKKKDRIWLDVTNENGSYKQLLLGYINGATNGIDRLYDGEMLVGENIVGLYSVLKDEEDALRKFTIQGRALPFNEDEELALGFSLKEGSASKNKIGIEDVEGVFETQEVYLIDTYEGIIHDLKSGDYEFESKAGEFNDRFKLVFQHRTLSVDSNEMALKDVTAAVSNSTITVDSNESQIQAIEVYNALGAVVYSDKGVDAYTTSVVGVAKTNSLVVVQVTLENGARRVIKLVF